MADASVSTGAMPNANAGWRPNQPTSVLPTSFQHDPRPWDPQGTPASSLLTGHYRWTRGGVARLRQPGGRYRPAVAPAAAAPAAHARPRRGAATYAAGMSEAALQQLFDEAVALIERRDYHAAQQRIGRMMAINPRDVDARRLAARMAIETGQLELAINVRKEICELAPREPSFRTQLGELYREQGRFGEAIAQFDTALRLDKQNTLALAAKAETLEMQGKDSQVASLLGPAMGRKPGPEIGGAWVRLLTRRGDLDGAIKAGRAILAAGAPSVPLRHCALALAAALEKAGDYVGAIEVAHHVNAMCAPGF